MTVTINGSTGVTTPGITSTGNVAVTGNVSATVNVDSPSVTENTVPMSRLVAGTPVTLTGTTTILSQTIPSWVKVIRISMSNVSTSGTNIVQFQVGSTSFTTTGYIGTASSYTATTNVAAMNTGFALSADNSAATTFSGSCTLVNHGSNTWVMSALGGTTSSARMTVAAGAITLAGALDRVQITTVGGTDTFDNGSVTLSYEG